MSKIRTNIIDAEWSYCLGQSRDALALVLRYAKGFLEPAMAQECIGLFGILTPFDLL